MDSGSLRNYCSIGGGTFNVVLGEKSGIGGGSLNSIRTPGGEVCNINGGFSNKISGGSSSAITGGGTNIIRNNGLLFNGAVISGGDNNRIRDKSDIPIPNGALITGGSGNLCRAPLSLITGGLDNKVKGRLAVVFGGKDNVANGSNSYAFGTNAKAVEDNSMIINLDGSKTVRTETNGQFLIAAKGYTLQIGDFSININNNNIQKLIDALDEE